MLAALMLLTCQTTAASLPGIAEIPALVQKHGLAGEWEQLGRALRQYTEGSKAACYLGTTRGLFADPLTTPGFARDLTDRLDAAARHAPEDLAAILEEARVLLDLAPTPPVEEIPEGPRLAFAQAVVAKAARDVRAALAPALEDVEAAELRTALVDLVDDFVRHIYIHEAKEHDNRRTLKQLRAVDQALLVKAATRLVPLTEPGFLRALADELKQAPPAPAVAGVTGALLFAQATDAGWILVGGPGRNTYDLPIALLVETGGDDSYSARATRSDLGNPINVVLDLAGNDTYEGKEACAQGCGLLGVSLLLDQEGKDRYRCARAGQGCGLGGIGILLDRHGDDSYEGDACVQGAGCLGVGLLLDRYGNDTLRAGLNAQGFAWPLSVGLLLDVQGNDQRIATGKYPSTYGTDGEWNAGSQGAAFGFRTVACGGFGILVDGGGDDVSRVGEFGFGVGYFYGTGIVRDRGGNDQVFASRYGIATGAHCGIGVVIDDQGNDLWDNRHTASIAGNWDITLSFFLDLAGNDRYLGEGITLGGATITSLAVFVDADGVDSYATGSDLAFGGCGHAEDVQRKTRSMAFCFDLGGKKDEYPRTSPLRPPPQNGSVVVRRRSDTSDKTTAESGAGLFVDR